ncbi:hypothetical protein [Cupriavidus sp. CuC1]|uniref:hypothetical protein n=1 Tax=Cupriavidus sp. CuC1 TaxID=3373131 RepID=UPI0037D42CD7
MSAVPSIKEVAVHVRRVFTDGSEATFNTQAASLEDALAAAQYLAGIDAPAAANAVIAKAAGKKEAAQTKTEPATSTEGNVQGSASASTQQSSQQSASTATSSSGEQKPDAPALDYDKDIKARVLRLAADQGPDTTRATLARFGVAKATELKKDQWPEFIAFIDQVIAKEISPEESLA